MSDTTDHEDAFQLSYVDRVEKSLRGDGSWLSGIAKQFDLSDPNRASSRQGDLAGRVQHPFDMEAVTLLKPSNIHHSACLEAKVSATVGLGFETETDRKRKEVSVMPAVSDVPLQEGQRPDIATDPVKPPGEMSKAEEVLNPLCEVTFLETMSDVIEDFWQTGVGYLEVVREKAGDPNSPVKGLFHVPAWQCFKVLENDMTSDFHWEVDGISREGTTGVFEAFARFGDLDGARQRNRSGEVTQTGYAVGDESSEIIQFRRPSSLSRHYSWPDFLAAVPTMELDAALTQHLFDFFNNRGVPEFMLFVKGQGMNPKQWAELKAAMRANIGGGNGYKSLVVNITNPNTEIQLETLGSDSAKDGMFVDLNEVLATRIVSAHGVPPMLAGILIPGKLGAANELPNALQLFQLLKIGPAQKLISATLGATLGNKEKSGLDLEPTDFIFKTVLDEMDIGKADTVARMRTPLAQAQAEGRDPAAGLKD